MSANTLMNPYQMFGTTIPAGMTTADALEYTGISGMRQRVLKPHLTDADGLPIDMGDIRINVGDVPLGDNGDRIPTALGAVKKGYQPFQYEAVLGTVTDGFGEFGVTPKIMGMWAGGRAAYAVYDLPSGAEVTVGGDLVLRHIVAATRADGAGAAKAFLTAERASCANMINSLFADGKRLVSIRHTRNADPRLMEQVEVLLGLAEDWDAGLAREITELQEQTVTRRQYADVVVPALLGERPDEKGRSQTIFDRKFEELVASWSSPVAAEGETAWRAYNAVTEHEQHHRSRNQRVMAEATLSGRTPMEGRVLQVLGSLA